MSRSVQMKVANPCHENWSNMTPGEQGRFCGSCQKTVIDFTAMSDKELLDHFSKTAGQRTLWPFYQRPIEQEYKGTIAKVWPKLSLTT